MTRYVIKKYVDATSLEEALRKEKNVKPEDAWKDEKQPEQTSTDQIGFDLATHETVTYNSPHMKRKKKK